jgi:hypothetical protein
VAKTPSKQYKFLACARNIGLAVVGYFAMKYQHEDIEQQLHAPQYEQRAWLHTPVVQMISPPSFDIDGLRMKFAYTSRNAGKNPAVYVNVQTEARIGQIPISLSLDRRAFAPSSPRPRRRRGFQLLAWRPEISTIFGCPLTFRMSYACFL